jgi:hypothetical protein
MRAATTFATFLWGGTGPAGRRGHTCALPRMRPYPTVEDARREGGTLPDTFSRKVSAPGAVDACERS